MVTVRDVGAFKALSHPIRVRILKHLEAHGPATSTTLGEALGESTGTTSYHLRLLQRHGFIEDMPERAVGKQRWWRWTGGPRQQAVTFADRAELSGTEIAAMDEADRAWFANDRELFERFTSDYRALGGWATGLRGSRYMTEDELAGFAAEYRELVNRSGHPAEHAPDGARPIELRFFALPAD